MMTLQNLLSPPPCEGLTTSDGFPETLQSKKDFLADSVLHVFFVYMYMSVCVYATSAQVSLETRRHWILGH